MNNMLDAEKAALFPEKQTSPRLVPQPTNAINHSRNAGHTLIPMELADDPSELPRNELDMGTATKRLEFVKLHNQGPRSFAAVPTLSAEGSNVGADIPSPRTSSSHDVRWTFALMSNLGEGSSLAAGT
ncbi:hypothetical protein F5146DRAFT_1126367 [Armillaria mellea]|nr:hypothetical protein F5146DRAFT_1126367 [Armillaria mellea]